MRYAIILLMLLAISGPVLAQEPPPDPPTTTPVPWATPTPMPETSEEPPVDFGWAEDNGVFVTVAERAVWIWQTVNQYRAMDAVTTLFLVGMTLLGFRNIVRRIKART